MTFKEILQENLLLTDSLQLKLIDFGLCSKPQSGVAPDVLNTCCGSPAYAAPELILGRAYYGSEVRSITSIVQRKENTSG